MRLVAACLLSAAAFLAHAGDYTAYGEAFADGAAVPVSEAIAAFDSHEGSPGIFTGRITEVCQMKGCWMVLEHEGQSARVMFGEVRPAVRAARRGVLYRAVARTIAPHVERILGQWPQRGYDRSGRA